MSLRIIFPMNPRMNPGASSTPMIARPCMSQPRSRNIANHHIIYRAHGGGDEESNQACLCDFCHLEGEHGGRLKVRGTGDALSWWFGRTPVMEVRGRDVVRRQPSVARFARAPGLDPQNWAGASGSTTDGSSSWIRR